MRLWSATRWLITLNIAVFVLDLLTFGRLSAYGALSAEKAVQHLQLWRFLTFQFLHASPGHLFFNMVALYFFGPFLERQLGRRAFAIFFVICGLAGAGTYLLQWRLHVLHVVAESEMVGASAGIFGVMAAATYLAPNMAVSLIFPPITFRLVTLLWIFLGIAFLTIWTAGENAGGEAAHLGGAAMGYLLIRNIHWLTRIGGYQRQRFWRPGDPAHRFLREEFRQK
jgi:membrane associated rhomboid family serine protease